MVRLVRLGIALCVDLRDEVTYNTHTGNKQRDREMIYHSEDNKLVAKVVKGELRSIGHNDKFGNLRGWVFLNASHAYNYHHDEYLFNALKDLLHQDAEFAEFVMSKMSMYKNTKVGASFNNFVEEVNKRERMKAHRPAALKMVVYKTDDNGRSKGLPLAIVEIESTGDHAENVKQALLKFNFGVDTGWHTAYQLTDEFRKELEDARDEFLNAAEHMSNLLA